MDIGWVSFARERAASSTWNGGEDVGAAISVLDADLKFVNRRPMEEIARSPRRTGCVRSRSSECQPSISPRIFNPTNALGVQYKPSHSSSPVPPSNRLSPITLHDDGPSTPPTNGIAMAHTAPVQGKLSVDNSSTHETLVEGSEDITHEISTPSTTFPTPSVHLVRHNRAR